MFVKEFLSFIYTYAESFHTPKFLQKKISEDIIDNSNVFDLCESFAVIFIQVMNLMICLVDIKRTQKRKRASSLQDYFVSFEELFTNFEVLILLDDPKRLDAFRQAVFQSDLSHPGKIPDKIQVHYEQIFIMMQNACKKINGLTASRDNLKSSLKYIYTYISDFKMNMYIFFIKDVYKLQTSQVNVGKILIKLPIIGAFFNEEYISEYRKIDLEYGNEDNTKNESALEIEGSVSDNKKRKMECESSSDSSENSEASSAKKGKSSRTSPSQKM